MPSDFALKAMNSIHRALLMASGGKVGWNVGGMEALKLTTTGRKSGDPRSVMLTAPIRVGDALVIVASRGGNAGYQAKTSREIPLVFLEPAH
jgi:F420H(2)-dependent quinone reductase